MRKIIAVTILAVSILSGRSAFAAVVLLQDIRSAQSKVDYVYGGNSSDAHYSPQVAFSEWSAVAGLDTLQSSTVTGGLMSGSGSGAQGFYVDKTVDYTFQKSSVFDIRFGVDVAQNLQLDAQLKAATQECCDYTYLTLTGPQGTIIGAIVQGTGTTIGVDPSVTDYSSSGLLNLSELIALLPGEYELKVGVYNQYVSGHKPSSGSWLFAGQFVDAPSTVPLPAAMWLFISSVGMTGLTRKFFSRKN